MSSPICHDGCPQPDTLRHSQEAPGQQCHHRPPSPCTNTLNLATDCQAHAALETEDGSRKQGSCSPEWWHNSTPGFQRLPYEILTFIVRDLTLEDIYDLSRTCHHFQYLVREENLARMLLRVGDGIS